jgi:hypothetical protein
MTNSIPKMTLALASVLAFTGAALAQPSAPSILGQWKFETAAYNVLSDGQSCRMTGDMVIERAPNGAYKCRFTARERCPHGEWAAEQTCTGVRRGDQLELTATIVKLTPANVSYAPDNWLLTIKSGSRMIGELRSADIAAVEFRRGTALVS